MPQGSKLKKSHLVKSNMKNKTRVKNVIKKRPGNIVKKKNLTEAKKINIQLEKNIKARIEKEVTAQASNEARSLKLLKSATDKKGKKKGK